MDNKIHGVDPNVTNPNNPRTEQAPPDPSNTSNIGQRVEQGVIDIKEGISEQSSEWEDKLERTIPIKNKESDNVENYLKNPSPEEINPEENDQA
jgi:hypothetical protein